MQTQHNDKPPIFRNWSTWYIIVIGFLVILIGLFYLLTKRFA